MSSSTSEVTVIDGLSFVSDDGCWAIDPNARTLAELLQDAASTFPDVEAFVAGEERLTFGEWWRRAGAVARQLADLGVKRGSVVAISLPPSLEFAVAYAAIARAGGVITGMNPRLGSRELDHITALAEPAVIISGPDLVDRLPEPYKPAVLLVDDLAQEGDRAPLDVVDVDETDPAIIVWTSGTTGLPKGAWFDNAGLRGSAYGSSDFIRRWDRRLLPLAFVHGGFMTKVWECVASGTTTVITPVPWRANEMLDLLERERITVATGAPTQWERLVALPDVAERDLSAFRLAITATAPASPELIKKMQSVLGVRVAVRFGSSESGPGTGTREEDEPEVMASTLGRPLPGAEVSIVDDEGNVVGPDVIGAIRLRHPGCMRGYWRDPEETAKALDTDGWLRTGDLGYIREDGNLVLSGRASDLYIRGGYNVYPREIELALLESDIVADVAVVGVPAKQVGEKGVAFIVPTDPAAAPSLDDIRANLRGRIADYKVPEAIRIVDELPLTAFMKVDRKRIKELALETFPDL
ncbi:class I adenylate-forming enzyme family protein [Microbacterium immunditiarum]|uniref:Acyl-CoA synthetase (AMP-forming)/AMP-acid ligase II n=1 Tax=Microbacterium immunditiarum TaxID=337480 RepID=A0A7Y9GQE3_9MICO|nr:class I adenylate-forming enzyme family protein [Microbacterium immunditiarum]NYE19640.1 acyl-CoA synthetase (AMP-forming)/AMP-acid ligase II [Microbacterium immunditiarum]